MLNNAKVIRDWLVNKCVFANPCFPALTLGYLLAAKCLSIYIIPGAEGDLVPTDPKWLGAWWMGFPIIATLLLLFSLPLMFFPERLPKTDTDANKEAKENLLEGKTPLKDDFKSALMRLLTNKLYVTNYFSTVFYVFAFMGFGTFMSKYMEYQVSCDWRSAGHVTPVLTSDWSSSASRRGARRAWRARRARRPRPWVSSSRAGSSASSSSPPARCPPGTWSSASSTSEPSYCSPL